MAETGDGRNLVMGYRTITRLHTPRQMGKLITLTLRGYREKLLTALTDIPRDSPEFKAALFECERILAFRGVTFGNDMQCPACRGIGSESGVPCPTCHGAGKVPRA